jgi:c-di-GMP-binding flagellar brake protein YcgR
MTTKPAKTQRYHRRDGERVRASLRVVIALADGEKQPATVLDVSTGGMQLDAKRAPAYGEAVTVIVELGRPPTWQLIPAKVRWFGKRGFGVEFDDLGSAQVRALAAFVSEASERGLG